LLSRGAIPVRGSPEETLGPPLVDASHRPVHHSEFPTLILLVPNVPLTREDADPVADIAATLGVPAEAITGWKLVRRSLDARHGRQAWRAVYRVELDRERPVRPTPGVRAWTPRDDERYGV